MPARVRLRYRYWLTILLTLYGLKPLASALERTRPKAILSLWPCTSGTPLSGDGFLRLAFMRLAFMLYSPKCDGSCHGSWPCPHPTAIIAGLDDETLTRLSYNSTNMMSPDD